jgi:hypothetical protein
VTAGAACHENPAEACLKAIDEAISVRVSVSRSQWLSVPPTANFLWVQSLEQRAALYANVPMQAALSFLTHLEQYH